MKINKISKKLIKPCTPTPQNLKNYHISFLDQNAGSTSALTIFFYKSKPHDDSLLEESLAKILVQFYPLAGRFIKTDQMVDCSDQGAEFITAQAPDFELLDLIGKTEVEIEHLECLVPKKYLRLDDAPDDPLLTIQITHFRCGGSAISLSANHKILDGASLGIFITAWSTATNILVRATASRVIPSFDASSLLPKKHLDVEVPPAPFGTGETSSYVKRLFFSEAAMINLKSRIRLSNGNSAASGVRIVCAVIVEALIRTDRATHGKDRDFVVLQPVNIRGKTTPPLPWHACGNFFVMAPSRRVAASKGEEIGVEALADLIGDSVRQTIADHAEILSPDRDGRDIVIRNLVNIGKEMAIPDTKFIFLNNLSKIGFYEADFGWGEPVWVSPGPQRHRIASAILMDNKEGDGIEAMLYLNKKDLSYFQKDEEMKLLMAYCSSRSRI